MRHPQAIYLDVVVVGGGPAGCAAAIRLAQLGNAVAVVTRSRNRSHYETLKPEVRPLLQQLGALKHVRGSMWPCYGTTSYWNSPNPAHRDHIFDLHGVGYHVDRQAFDQGLRRAVQDHGIADFNNVRITSLANRSLSRGQPSRIGVTVEHSSRRVCHQLQTRWIIDATGRAAAVAKRMGAIQSRLDNQISVAATVANGVNSSSSRLRVETTSSGWWYTIDLRNGRTYGVFETDAALWPSSIRRRLAFWRQQAGESPRLRHHLLIQEQPQLRAMPSSSSIASQYCGPNWIAVGDAALALDPLSGDGVIRALQTGLMAADVVSDGSDFKLRDYSNEIDKIAAQHLVERSIAYQNNAPRRRFV